MAGLMARQDWQNVRSPGPDKFIRETQRRARSRPSGRGTARTHPEKPRSVTHTRRQSRGRRDRPAHGTGVLHPGGAGNGEAGGGGTAPRVVGQGPQSESGQQPRPPSVLGHGRVSSPLCLQNQAPWCGLPVPPLLLGGSLGSQADGGSQTP